MGTSENNKKNKGKKRATTEERGLEEEERQFEEEKQRQAEELEARAAALAKKKVAVEEARKKREAEEMRRAQEESRREAEAAARRANQSAGAGGSGDPGVAGPTKASITTERCDTCIEKGLACTWQTTPKAKACIPCARSHVGCSVGGVPVGPEKKKRARAPTVGTGAGTPVKRSRSGGTGVAELAEKIDELDDVVREGHMNLVSCHQEMLREQRATRLLLHNIQTLLSTMVHQNADLMAVTNRMNAPEAQHPPKLSEIRTNVSKVGFKDIVNLYTMKPWYSTRGWGLNGSLEEWEEQDALGEQTSEPSYSPELEQEDMEVDTEKPEVPEKKSEKSESLESEKSDSDSSSLEEDGEEQTLDSQGP